MTSTWPLLKENLTHFQLIPLTKYFWITISHYNGWFLYNVVLTEYFDEDNQMSFFFTWSVQLHWNHEFEILFLNLLPHNFEIDFFLPIWNKFVISKFTTTPEKEVKKKAEKNSFNILCLIFQCAEKNHIFLSHMHLWILCITQKRESDHNFCAN